MADEHRKHNAPQTAVPDRQGMPSPRLLPAKVSIPPRAARYLDRPELIERAMPTGHRAVLLRAPGGYGKTTLLAECCRCLAAEGAVAAWLSVDEQDTAAVLDSYLAFAFQHAGLDAIGVLDREDAAIAPFEHQAGLLLHVIAAQDCPCVLVLDELERLSDPESVALVNFLLQRAPANFHLALACRQLPGGINLATPVLEGAAAVLSADQLRFSKPEIEAFFGGGLSRRQATSVMTETAGWPIAVQIHGNQRDGDGSDTSQAVLEVVDQWVESRLWHGLSAVDRELLLDLGLFDWIDGELLDEALDDAGMLDRFRSLPSLAGLLEPLRPGASEAWRLHPLIANFCRRHRRRETPKRYRAINRRIAMALSAREDTVSAMRHAAESRDAELVGDILENAGGVRLWAREGLVRSQSADRCLTRDMFDARPRLALLRCVVLIMTGHVEQARPLYTATLERLGVHDQDFPSEDLDVEADRCIVEGLLYMRGGEPFDSRRSRALAERVIRMADDETVEPVMRGSFEHGLCFAYSQIAQFDEAARRAERALRCLGAESPYMTLQVETQLGQIAMAQGRVEAAQSCYARARRGAKSQFLRDPQLVATIDILALELNLERGLQTDARERPVRMPQALMRSGTPFGGFAAASGVVAEMTLASGGVDAALTALERMREFTRRCRLEALERIVSAQFIGLLARSRRGEEAERQWRLVGLYDDADACLSLRGQSWRELEAFASARLWMLIDGEAFAEGRRFLDRLTGLCAERGLRRTWMRGLALGVALEHRAKHPAAAEVYLAEYLRLFKDTGYTRPLVREREAARVALIRFLTTARDSDSRTHALELIGELAAEELQDGQVSFSGREMQVLQRLATHTNSEIAEALGLSTDGVRYHLRNIFAKTGARRRKDAVERARSLGIRLPE